MHNIPSLREAIFHHDSSNSSEEFFALQKTMALLSTSKYSWVDPIDEVTLYRKLMPITPQQDAAEFLGKCIEICEKEFKNDNDSENITSLTSIYSGMLTVTGKDSKDQVMIVIILPARQASLPCLPFCLLVIIIVI